MKNEQANTTCLKIVIIGAGAVSSQYFESFSQSPLTEVVAAVDPSEAVGQWISQNYSDVPLEADYKTAIEKYDADIVVVCTPHYLHLPMVMDSLNAGKHVICEKPLGMTTAECDEMLELADKKGLKLLVGLNMRFGPRIMKIKKMIEAGQLGKVFLARASYLGYEVDRLADANHWKGDLRKAGGGVLLDGGYHVVDLANALLGPAKSVQALGGQFVIDNGSKGEDNIALIVEYANGAVAEIMVSFTVCNVGCRKEPTLILGMDVFGTEASIFSGYNSATIKEHFELVNSDGKEVVSTDDVDCLDKNAHFLECITNGSQPLVTALDARNANAVVDAAYESIRTGKKVAVDWKS